MVSDNAWKFSELRSVTVKMLVFVFIIISLWMSNYMDIAYPRMGVIVLRSSTTHRSES